MKIIDVATNWIAKSARRVRYIFQPDDSDELYTNGRAACADGYTRSACPEPKGSECRKEWLQGWNDERRDIIARGETPPPYLDSELTPEELRR